MTCQHTRYVIHSRLYARETRFEPAEYEHKAECQDCGEWLDIEDLPADESEEENES